jgi:iron-sulfur cluster assembly accessory protein
VADSGEFLRIEVTGGGCSGFQYKFDMDTVLNEDDIIVSKNGSRVVVDETSLNLIRGAVIDYKEELIRQSFSVSQNPNAEKGCSCGASFTLKTNG